MELALLDDLLRRAARGAGHSVMICGEAGIGKSALSRSFLKTAGASARVLKGACEDLSIAEPLAPLLDLAREAGWELPRHIATEGDRLSLFSEALEVLTDPAGTTVILVEDVHWADDATLDFLRFLARRIEDRPILLLMTARDDHEGRPHIRRIVGTLTSDAVTRIILSPLSRSAVASLFAATGRDPDEVYCLSGGNAFYVSELLRGSRDDLPPSVRDAVLFRTETLEAAAREILDAVSLFPRQAETAVLEALFPRAAEGIDACVESGLLEDAGAYVSFRHELARRAIAESLPGTRKRALHARLLSCLAGRPDEQHARLLHHAIGAGDGAAIASYAPAAAADALRLRALKEAARYLKLALDHLGPDETRRRAALLRDYAWTCYQLGRVEDAIEAEKAALEDAKEAGDIVREGDGYRRLCRYHWLHEDRESTLNYARLAMQTLANCRGPELAMAYSNVAQLAMLDNEYESVAEPSEEAMKIAAEFDRPDILAHSLNNLGMSLVWSDPERGRALLAESLETALRIGSADDAGRALTNAGYFELYRLEYDRATALFERGLAYCVATELEGFIGYLTGSLAWVMVQTGAFARAAEIARTDPNWIGVSGGSRYQSFSVLAAEAWLALRAGEDFGASTFDQLQVFIRRMDELQRLDVFAQIVAERAWMGLEPPDRALDLLSRVFERTSAVERTPLSLLWFHKLAPRDRVRPTSPGLLAPVRLQVEGRWSEAAAAWGAKGARFFEALALAEGDAEARHLAVRMLQAMGAEGTAATVLREMRRDGIAPAQTGPRSSTLANPAGLTRRQMEVLRQLNDGLTNAEIAERLFISEKTVDHHVSAILAKLEATSRGEAAAKARQAGWLDAGS